MIQAFYFIKQSLKGVGNIVQNVLIGCLIVYVALSSSDGLVGSVIANGKYIVTSPNIKSIPDPPLGGDRQLYLRENLRFGDDDPLQWPQPYVAKYAHLSFILRSCGPCNPLAIMWWVPDRSSHKADNGMLFGIGKLCTMDLVDLKSPSLQLLDRATLPMFCGKQLVTQLSNTLQHLLHRLEHIATNFFTMRLGVREAQRVFLELRAILDYKEHMDSLPVMSRKVCCNIMGAFTFELGVCEKLFQAQIPVWLIRLYSELHSIRIKKVVSLDILVTPFRSFPVFAPSIHLSIVDMAMSSKSI